MPRFTISGAELKKGDVILHPVRPKDAPKGWTWKDATEWRQVATVRGAPTVKAGSWSLSVPCRVEGDEKLVISIAPTEVVVVERKGAK